MSIKIDNCKIKGIIVRNPKLDVKSFKSVRITDTELELVLPAQGKVKPVTGENKILTNRYLSKPKPDQPVVFIKYNVLCRFVNILMS